MGQQTVSQYRVCFPVSDVPPGKARLSEISLRSAMERTVQASVITCPNPEEKVVESGDFHGFIAAAALAYKQHYQLVLSPDIIWLTILQGVAQHVANHSETIRSRMVAHQTKIELVVNGERLPQTDADMMSATSAFRDLIERHTRPEKHFLLKAEFSTTTDVERIVGAVVIMDAFKPYFDYVFRIICGIPAVILEGTTADWELLAAKVKMLHESDLEISWWTRHLLPLCKQFIRASRGKIDRRHWENMCKLVERYGVDDLNGWLLKFIPYVRCARQDKNQVPSDRNPVLELTAFALESDRMGKITGCTSDMLPSGLSRAPLACLNRVTGTTTEYQFVAGFAGVSQSQDDLSLRPMLGWAITDGTRIDNLINRLRNEHDVHPPDHLKTKELLQLFRNNLPADMWRFFTETGGATLNFKRSSQEGIRCSIKPAGQIRPTVDYNCFGHGSKNPVEFEERQKMARAYRDLLAFAEADTGTAHFVYFFGEDPEMYYSGIPFKKSRGKIFRWTGEPSRESFVPVAHTFSDWLQTMLEQSSVTA